MFDDIKTLTTSLRQPNSTLILLQPQFTQSYPRHNTNQHQHAGHNDSPVLDMRHIETIRRPARRGNRRKTEHRNQIPGNTVILVDALGLVHASKHTGDIVLRETNNTLDVHEHVEQQAQSRMRRLKVLMAWPCFVDLDDDQAGCERCCAEYVEGEVGKCARAFLLLRMRGLDDEGCLDGEEEAGLQIVRVSMS